MVYNKQNIAESLADKFSVSKVMAEQIIEAIFENIQETVKAGEKVSIASFGIFDSKAMGAKEARNPRTGEKLTVPPSVKFKFRPSAALKEFMNRS